MAKPIPFDDETMTLIMGLGGPEKPGQHGRTNVMAPTTDAVGVITQIRDLCEEFLINVDKKNDEDKEEPEDGEETTDMKIDED